MGWKKGCPELLLDSEALITNKAMSFSVNVRGRVATAPAAAGLAQERLSGAVNSDSDSRGVVLLYEPNGRRGRPPTSRGPDTVPPKIKIKNIHEYHS